MQLTIHSFDNGAMIPSEYAFGMIDPQQHVTLSDNRNPHLSWSNVPSNAKSLVMICVDTDVPTVGDNVNQEGTTVAKDLPRTDFFHWVLIDIPTSVSEINTGDASDGVTAKGKPVGHNGIGINGINDYTAWFANDPDMAGNYGGYDGPCPPWNDELLHHYRFRLYALDVDSLNLEGTFDGRDVEQAMQGHVIEQCEWVGVYSLNPDVVNA